MAADRAYLDYNASAPLLEEARGAMLNALENCANASSVHAGGRAARRRIEAARREVAALVGAEAQNVTFTSGATEAAANLLVPEWRRGRETVRFSRLYVSAADHLCILNGGRFVKTQIVTIGVDGNGRVDLDELSAALHRHDAGDGLPLVAVHVANNETGVIQPFREIAALARAAKGITVFDAVQAAGRISIDITEGWADFVILSSHKIGGPKGAGAIVAGAVNLAPTPLIPGGGQEKGRRAGTENVPAIAGFGAAAQVAARSLDSMDGVRSRRNEIERLVLSFAPDAEIFGAAMPRLPNTSFFAIPGVSAETAQIAFDLAGVAVSAGSACSSGRVGPSHVLKAMGRGGDAGGIRVSIGSATAAREVAQFESALAQIVSRRRENRFAA